MAIPAGVSQRDWTAALEQFRQIVGPSWVFTSDEDIALYRDAYSPQWGEPEERLISAAVAPESDLRGRAGRSRVAHDRWTAARLATQPAITQSCHY